MVSLRHKVVFSLDKALEHVHNKLLVVINQHSQDSSNSKEYLVPLHVAYLEVLTLWYLNFEQLEESILIFLSRDLQNKGESIHDLVSAWVAIVNFVFENKSQKLDDVGLNILVQANCCQDMLKELILGILTEHLRLDLVDKLILFKRFILEFCVHFECVFNHQ